MKLWYLEKAKDGLQTEFWVHENKAKNIREQKYIDQIETTGQPSRAKVDTKI